MELVRQLRTSVFGRDQGRNILYPNTEGVNTLTAGL